MFDRTPGWQTGAQDNAYIDSYAVKSMIWMKYAATNQTFANVIY